MIRPAGIELICQVLSSLPEMDSVRSPVHSQRLENETGPLWGQVESRCLEEGGVSKYGKQVKHAYREMWSLNAAWPGCCATAGEIGKPLDHQRVVFSAKCVVTASFRMWWAAHLHEVGEEESVD